MGRAGLWTSQWRILVADTPIAAGLLGFVERTIGSLEP
jgi:hypothetical protein